MSFIMKNLGCNEVNTNKSFTLEEVNACIPEVEQAFYRLLQMNAQVNQIIHQLKAHDVILQDSFHHDGPADQDEESLDSLSSLKVLLTAIQHDMNAITQKGGAIQNIDDGIVNWNGVADERPMIFSWKLGEKTIQFWQESFKSTDRKPLTASIDAYCN